MRRGSAFVSPVCSSSEEEEEKEEEEERTLRRRSLWSQLSSSSSESSDRAEFEEEAEAEEEDADSDALADFVGRRSSARSAAQPSAAKLDRLRRIFLNKPPAAKRRAQNKEKKKKMMRNSSSADATSSNSSGEENEGEEEEERRRGARADQSELLTLSINHHVVALRDQVRLLARQNTAHPQQWQAMLTQAIEELQFVQQHEQRALQSHVQLLQESYALRLEVFEQQYRAKVAEIRNAMRCEIAQQRRQSEAAVVATAARLQQTHALLAATSEDVAALALPPVTEPAEERREERTAVLAKTAAFLAKQRSRDECRRHCSRIKTKPPPDPCTAGSLPPPVPVVSPVARQRAKLRMLEQKLASFSPETVNRVAKSVENQERERHRRQQSDSCDTRPSTLIMAPERDGQHVEQLRAAPLSPLRKRASIWHNGISREDPTARVLSPPETDSLSKPQLQLSLSRRFLRPEEERELRCLRNSIGLAKDWMEQHDHHPDHHDAPRDPIES